MQKKFQFELEKERMIVKRKFYLKREEPHRRNDSTILGQSGVWTGSVCAQTKLVRVRCRNPTVYEMVSLY